MTGVLLRWRNISDLRRIIWVGDGALKGVCVPSSSSQHYLEFLDTKLRFGKLALGSAKHSGCIDDDGNGIENIQLHP